MSLNFERIAALSLVEAKELIERVALGKKGRQEARKRGQESRKQRKQELNKASAPKKPEAPPSKEPGTKRRPTKLVPGVPKDGVTDKKKKGPKAGSKAAEREERLKKVPQDREKGAKYCITQTGRGGSPKLWVRPGERRRAFCRSMGPRELRRFRKKLKMRSKGKAGAPKSLRALLQQIKGVRRKPGETMGDLSMRRRMSRQLGNILMHGGMSKDRLAKVAQGKPQAIKAFKKFIAGRGGGKIGMQKLTNSKAMAKHFNRFMKEWDRDGAETDLKSRKVLMGDWRSKNDQENIMYRGRHGQKGTGFEEKIEGERAKARESRQRSKARKQVPAKEEAPFAREDDEAQRWLDKQKAASEKLRLFTAAQAARRAYISVTERFDEFNPMIAEGDYDAMRTYAMYRADHATNPSRIAAIAIALV